MQSITNVDIFCPTPPPENIQGKLVNRSPKYFATEEQQKHLSPFLLCLPIASLRTLHRASIWQQLFIFPTSSAPGTLYISTELLPNSCPPISMMVGAMISPISGVATRTSEQIKYQRYLANKWQNFVQISGLSLFTRCISLDELFNLYKPQFPQLQNGICNCRIATVERNCRWNSKNYTH